MDHVWMSQNMSGPTRTRVPYVEECIFYNKKIRISDQIGKWLPSMNTAQHMNAR